MSYAKAWQQSQTTYKIGDYPGIEGIFPEPENRHGKQKPNARRFGPFSITKRGEMNGDRLDRL